MKYLKQLSIAVCALLSVTLAHGGLITHADYQAGTTITSAGQNSNENTIFNEFNGNIDDTNIKTGASINGSKLGAGTVTTTQLANNTITSVNMSSPSITGATANSAGATGGNIAAGTVSTPDLRPNAASIVETSGSGTSARNTDVTTVSTTTVGGTVVLMGFFAPTVSASAGVIAWSLDITEGANSIPGCHTQMSVEGQGTTAQHIFPLTIVCSETPVAGTYVYHLSYTVTSGSFVSSNGYSLISIEHRD